MLKNEAAKPDNPKSSKPKESKDVAPKPVTVEKLRNDLPVLFENALNDPTEKNVKQTGYAMAVAFDKAWRLSQVWAETFAADPILDRTSMVPVRSLGAQSIERVSGEAKAKALDELSKTSGLYFFVDSHCEMCGIQLRVLPLLNQIGMSYMVISLDGKMPKGYEKVPFQTDNGFFRKFDLKVTPAVVMVYNPQRTLIKNNVDSNYYSIVAHGFYSFDDLSKQIAFAGLKRGMLSKETARDLDVWNRGVASVEDLRLLRVSGMNYEEAYKPIRLKELEK
jgi:conjugal transfer pilus assembly protein TraF